ncbi:MAG TPA: cupredoxin domain-containing protein, partial [Aggregatilineales bacterium]|nr:cupredoxin domain-containing protein [Aggregatilineales bacterium]
AAQKNAAAMKPIVDQITKLNSSVMAGVPDGAGQISITRGSCGLDTAYAEALNMAAIPLFAGNVVPKAMSTEASTAASTSTVTLPPVPASTVMVTMEDLSFAPAKINLKAGLSVVFVNQSNRNHTATADDTSFDTGVLAPGASSKAIRFDKPGTYPFYCQFHGGVDGVGMSGVIMVQ